MYRRVVLSCQLLCGCCKTVCKITDGGVGMMCEEAIVSHFKVFIEENYHGSESPGQDLNC